MIDGGIIAGYLAAAVARGGKRLLDTAVNSALDRLAGVVSSRLGTKVVANLEERPSDPQAQQDVSAAIQAAADRDAGFARELATLQRQLDEAGARPLINEVRSVGINAQLFAPGQIHIGDHYESNYSNDYDPGDEIIIGQGPGRVLAVLGLLIGLAGFGGWIYFIFTGFGGGDDFLEFELLPGVPFAPVAFGAFVVGGIVYGLGASMSKAARQQAQGQLRRRPS